METSTDTTKDKTKGRGRQGAGKQTGVKQPKVVADRIDELVDLTVKSKTAKEKLDEAITKCAEDSNYLAVAVKKFVTARAGEKFEEKHREIDQQAELFDKVGGE